MTSLSVTLSAKKILLFVIVFLVATNLVIWADIFFLRQALAFLFITILPGRLFLQALRLEKLGAVETILYSVGLSLALAMFAGFLANLVYPLFGISQPLSVSLLAITLSVIVLVISLTGYFRNRNILTSVPVNMGELFTPAVLFLLLLPVLSILGAYLFSFYGTNVVLLLVIGLVSLAIIAAAFGIIPSKLFPLAIFMMALALLLHRVLVPFELLPSGDVLWEYYYNQIVVVNSSWDPGLSGNLNAMLSVVMQPTVYSKLMNIDGAWVLKVIYPLIFALVPLALYKAYQKQTTATVALLASFLFMSVVAFFYTLPTMGRQEIAELFYVLIIMLLLSREMNGPKRNTLMIIFGASLVVSHYGLSYIFIAQIVMALFILMIIQRRTINGFSPGLPAKLDESGGVYATRGRLRGYLAKLTLAKGTTLSVSFVVLYCLFALGWYLFTANASVFNSIVNISAHMYNSITTQFFSLVNREPEAMAAVGVGAPIRSWLSYIFRPLQYATQFFIIVGLAVLAMNYKRTQFTREYLAMLLISCGLIFATIVLPTFSKLLNTERTYHIALILIAPFCILGGEAVVRFLFRLFRRRISLSRSACARILLLVLVPYLLFNTGFVHIVVGEKTGAVVGLRQTREGNEEERATFYMLWPQKEDVAGARWLAENSDDNPVVYAGWTSKHFLLGPYARVPFKNIHVLDNQTHVPEDSFAFLRYYNTRENRIITDYIGEDMDISKTTEIDHINSMNKIYSNGGSEVYK